MDSNKVMPASKLITAVLELEKSKFLISSFYLLELRPAKSSVYPGTADFHSSPTRGGGPASRGRDDNSCTRATSALTASKRNISVDKMLIGCISHL